MPGTSQQQTQQAVLMHDTIRADGAKDHSSVRLPDYPLNMSMRQYMTPDRIACCALIISMELVSGMKLVTMHYFTVFRYLP